MKRLVVVAIALAAVSCTTRPASLPETGWEATAPAQVRKEYQREVKVPVVVKETVSYADGVVDRIVTHEYDEGLMYLLASYSSKPSSLALASRVSYGYADGRLASKAAYAEDGSASSRVEYAYDADGNPIRETTLDGKGAVQSVSEWAWEKGLRTSWRVSSGDGTVLARTDYYYDDGSLASARLYDGSGGPRGRVEYGYDADGALMSTRYYSADGKSDGRIEYRRDGNRLVEESVYRANGRLERKLTYGYGLDGELLRKTLHDGSGKAREHVDYEYVFRIATETVVYYE